MAVRQNAVHVAQKQFDSLGCWRLAAEIFLGME
jgi:hypothetical protein